MSRRVALGLALLLACAGCDEKQPQAHAPVAGQRSATPPAGTAGWEIGDDVAGKQVEIDGVMQDVPDDVAATKREMDQVAADVSKQMDQIEVERLDRFKDPDNQP